MSSSMPVRSKYFQIRKMTVADLTCSFRDGENGIAPRNKCPKPILLSIVIRSLLRLMVFIESWPCFALISLAITSTHGLRGLPWWATFSSCNIGFG